MDSQLEAACISQSYWLDMNKRPILQAKKFLKNSKKKNKKYPYPIALSGWAAKGYAVHQEVPASAAGRRHMHSRATVGRVRPVPQHLLHLPAVLTCDRGDYMD